MPEIWFPHLGIEISHLDRAAFTLFGNDVYWYGIFIGLAVILGLALAMLEAKRTGQNPDLYVDFVLYALIFAVIGARLYYVIFSWDFYSQNPAKIFALREGGLAIYGGIIGAVLTAVVYCKVKKQDFWLLADTAAPCLAFGQMIGRWGNFFNREAFGGYTDTLLAMRLPFSAVRADEVTELMMEKAEEIGGETFIQVHPTFLYESLWNLGVLFLLLLMTKKKFKKADGEIFLWYLLLYGAGRFWIEGLRTDQLRIWGTDIAVSQLLAAVLALCSGLLIILIRSAFRGGRNTGRRV
jgi:phosphatidylglycerol:prolipoprotein diacylglycerol transferase